jgi:hypothetical protein
MIRRCNNKKSEKYPRWGGRGISVCKRWFESFENFVSDMGEKPDGLSLDRIDNDGNYEPGNCRWSTQKEQIHNSSVLKITQLMRYAIHRMYSDYNYKPDYIAQIFDVNIATISKILSTKLRDAKNKKRENIIKDIKKHRDNGLMYKEIVSIFNREGRTTMYGKKWNLSLIIEHYRRNKK